MVRVYPITPQSQFKKQFLCYCPSNESICWMTIMSRCTVQCVQYMVKQLGLQLFWLMTNFTAMLIRVGPYFYLYRGALQLKSHAGRHYTLPLCIDSSSLPLNGQIFKPRFFHNSNMLGQVTNGVKYFRFWLRFCWDIRIFPNLPGVWYHSSAQSHSPWGMQPRGGPHHHGESTALSSTFSTCL